MQWLVPSLRSGPEDAGSAGTDIHFEKARDALASAWPVRSRQIQELTQALESGRVGEAKAAAAKFLAKHPRDPDALNLLAETARRAGRIGEAEAYLARCVHWSPDHEFYRYGYAVLLSRLGKPEGAMAETGKLLAKQPDNLLYRNLKASLLRKLGKHDEALICYRHLLDRYPDSPTLWAELGSTLRSLGGRREECIAAFRKAAELAPSNGRMWWNLAGLKVFRFTTADVEMMEAQLEYSAGPASFRAELHYALGKAHDDVKNYEKSFENYSKGNAIRRLALNYDPEMTTAMVSRNKAVFTAEFLRERSQSGCPSAEPIFVLGLQRSGSTLIEQILGSHSAIEPAGELQYLLKVVADDVMPKTGPDYPCGMGTLEPADLQAIGEKYLAYTTARRPEGRPYFVDKCPYNMWHVGLICLILPNARIIDARRHPLGCCYANFTMSFEYAPALSYRQTEIARFYADYVRLMAHFDRVQPGKIHRVIYERLVADLETEVRRMLDFLGLPFEQACL
jgi:tetratricopeptide (TPR) repeat protein